MLRNNKPPETLYAQVIGGGSLPPLLLQRLAHETNSDQRRLMERSLPSDHLLFKELSWNISVEISENHHLFL